MQMMGINTTSLLVPSKLGQARDETHRSQKTEKNTGEKKREENKGRAIKKTNRKWGKRQ
jgi:hypothetical protein